MLKAEKRCEASRPKKHSRDTPRDPGSWSRWLWHCCTEALIAHGSAARLEFTECFEHVHKIRQRMDDDHGQPYLLKHLAKFAHNGLSWSVAASSLACTFRQMYAVR